ncbi:hypothetical protein BAS10_07350 [Elizabethkingia meningoseptica]|uniref:hypothetical protein n=1 Tax=Elizabethkingia meningoseptica TaxID=238 RepID=UPI0009992998|nr:hypothetical protein [Elizabethkingia meningoseptica]OPB96857.1 hypothetical protein BAS10_07350 [Elizabethkingia meningoseptica]
MNQNISKLFFVIKNNEIIGCDSNLKELISALPPEIRDIRSYDYYYRQFINTNYFQLEFNRDYYFQKKEYVKGKLINQE